MKASSINEILKTGEEWSKDPSFVGLTILDHDGFDRQNFEYSFQKQKMTRKEFERRLMDCTLQWSLPRL